MLPSFRSATLFIVALATSYGAQSHSAAALTSSGQLPLKYTALFGGEASISAIAVDTEGSAYIAGTANSPLPATAEHSRPSTNPLRVPTTFQTSRRRYI